MYLLSRLLLASYKQSNPWHGQQTTVTYSLKLERKHTHYKYSHRNMKEDRISKGKQENNEREKSNNFVTSYSRDGLTYKPMKKLSVDSRS